MHRGITTNILGGQGARGGQGGQEPIVVSVPGKGLVNVAEDLRKSDLVQLAGYYGGVTIQGLTDPEMEVCANKGDTIPTRVKVVFKVVGLKGKVKSGMWVTVELSPIDLDSLPQIHFDVGSLKENELTLLIPLIGGRHCTSPPLDEPYAKVVIAMGGTFVLVKVIPEVSEHRQQLLLLKDEKAKKDAAKELAAADKRAREKAARELANARIHLAQQQADARREGEAFEIQLGLQCLAISLGFGTVEEMRAADARAEEQQRQAAEEERLRLMREAERAVECEKALAAQQRKADREAQAKASHLAKFGGKKGSPPPSSSSSRSASASPPPPSGGQAGRR